MFKCTHFNNHYNLIIHEVKSHVPVNSTIGNDIADNVAGLAISIPFNHSIPLAWFSWLNSKTVYKDFRCCRQTVLWDTLDPS